MNQKHKTGGSNLKTAQPATSKSSGGQDEVVQYNNLAFPRRVDPYQLRRVIENPGQATPAGILQIQRTYGNQAFLRLQKSANQNLSPVVAQIPVQRTPSSIIQRLVTQIVANEKGDVINNIHIIGRPTRTFTDSMGDHTTAFSVHTASLKLKLTGKTYKEAVAIVNGFVDASKKLPGLQLSSNLARENEVEMLYEEVDDEEVMQVEPKKNSKQAPEFDDDEEAEEEQGGARISRAPHGNRLDVAEKEMDTLRADAENHQNFLTLQNYINAYLEFRELIPLSVINTGKKAKGSSGKGKGESRPVKLLTLFEKDPDQFVPTMAAQLEGRKTAELKLIDNSKLKDNTKKIRKAQKTEEYSTAIKNLPKKRAEYLREAIYAVFDSQAAGKVASEVQSDLLKSMAPGLTLDILSINRIEMMVAQHIQSIQASFPLGFKASGINQTELELAVKRITKSTLTEELNFYKRELGTALNRKERYQLNEQVGRAPKKQKLGDGQIAKPINPDIAKTDGEIDAANQAIKTLEDILKNYDKVVINNGVKLDVLRMTRSQVNQQTLATQVMLDEDGNITELNFAGRSPSPFSGSMGAHTTAWRVHLDVILAKLLGKSVGDAITAMDGLIADAVETYNTFIDKFKAHSTHIEKALTAYKQLTVTQQKIKAAEPQAKAFMLQQYINELLTFINFTPGATLEATDTGGKTEGIHRRTIREFEADQTTHTLAEVKKAIWGLLDIKEANDSVYDTLETNHLKQIEQAYPVAYKAVFQNGARLRSTNERTAAIEEEKAANTKKGRKRKNDD